MALVTVKVSTATPMRSGSSMYMRPSSHAFSTFCVHVLDTAYNPS